MCNYPKCNKDNAERENNCIEHVVDYPVKRRGLSVREMQERLKTMAKNAPKWGETLEGMVQDSLLEPPIKTKNEQFSFDD